MVISISFFLPDNQWSERNVICIIRYWMEYHNHYYYIIITNLSFIFYSKNIFKCFSTIKLIRPFEKFKGNSCSGLLLGWRLMAVIMIVGLRQEALQCQYAHDLDRYNHGGWGSARPSLIQTPGNRLTVDSWQINFLPLARHSDILTVNCQGKPLNTSLLIRIPLVSCE